MVAVSLSLIGQVCVIYFPPLQSVFQTEAIYMRGRLILIPPFFLLLLNLSCLFCVFFFRLASSHKHFEQCFHHLRVPQVQVSLLTATAARNVDQPTAGAVETQVAPWPSWRNLQVYCLVSLQSHPHFAALTPSFSSFFRLFHPTPPTTFYSEHTYDPE